MELVPFQLKRKKQFKPDTKPVEAVREELLTFYQKYFPAVFQAYSQEKVAGPSPVLDSEVKNLQTRYPIDTVSFTDVATAIAQVTSPAILEDSANAWTLLRLELPVAMLNNIEHMVVHATQDTKAVPLIELLPKPYQAIITDIYTSSTTLSQLTTFLESKKRAKRYLRILQKRLGIYKQRKPPFKKTSSIKV